MGITADAYRVADTPTKVLSLTSSVCFCLFLMFFLCVFTDF